MGKTTGGGSPVSHFPGKVTHQRATRGFFRTVARDYRICNSTKAQLEDGVVFRSVAPFVATVRLQGVRNRWLPRGIELFDAKVQLTVAEIHLIIAGIQLTVAEVQLILAKF